MSTSDLIAVCAAAVSALALVVSVLAWREARRTNQIALSARHSQIYDALRELVFAGQTSRGDIDEKAVEVFRPYAIEAEKFLPRPIADEVSSFFEACETVVWSRSLSAEADVEYVHKGQRAAQVVFLSGVEVENRLLQYIRKVADA